MQKSTTDATYSPAVLIIDDDASVRAYYKEKFHEETSIGVITASRLDEAKHLIDAENLRIDAVIADIFFDHGTTAPEFGLRDGIDILAYTQEVRPKVPKYVLSYWSQRSERRQKADKNELVISEWFDKVFVAQTGQVTTPWATVERHLIVRRLKADTSFSARLLALGINPEVDERYMSTSLRHPEA